MKLKIISIFAALLVFMVACGSGFALPDDSSELRPAATVPPTVRPTATRKVPPTTAWYEGGTLHDKTVVDWMNATYANRLATAGDWTAVFTEFEDMDEAKRLAEDLAECVDGSVDAAPETMKVGDLAAACAVLMGWEPK